MKTIGLLGGMSWESSIEYYRIINQETKRKLGDLHSAKSLMYSVDFAEIEALQHKGDWVELTKQMIKAAQNIENGGADFLVICTNTMHKMADKMQSKLKIPIFHIADATANTIKKAGINKIALLGTKFTMEEDFYKGRLIAKHGLDVIVPSLEDRNIIHQIIYDELVIGKISPKSKAKYLAIINKLKTQGAEGIILGCTEIGLLIKQTDSELPVFDTTLIHALAAVEYALA
ncbi:MAG TPA: aspartate/glutamate racemase family protein [Trueperaceae bacterium]|nr:aspartate/glutamate racemase family protein [Trueperaceae bacterium]